MSTIDASHPGTAAPLSRERREFIRSTAMAAATAALAATTGRSFALPVLDNQRIDDRGVTWDKAPCRFCGTGCHVQVGVKDNRVVAIAGDVKAEVNRGLLCVKGYHVGKVLYGSDRLTQPLLRRNGRHEPISWDEAIDIIAERVLEAPDRFGFYGSGQWTIPEGCAANKFMKAGLGSNQIDGNPRLCMSSAVTGFLSCYGVDEPAGCYDDLDACDVLIMWGNNPAEMHPVLFSRVTDRRARGEEVLCIDLSTRRTRTTDQCQEYLEMKPHGDLAVANGIAHLLIRNGTYDEQFVSNHCNFRQLDPDRPDDMYGKPMSFEEYKQALEKYTPEHVEQLSGVPAGKIRMLGDLFGDRRRKITSLWCMGMNQHTRGTAINCLVHSIHFLSGHFGTPGDSPTSLTGQPSACGTVREAGTLSHLLPGGRIVADAGHRADAEDLWNVPRGRIKPSPGHHTVAMFDHFCSPSDRPDALDTLWVQVTNPGQTLPNLHKLFHRKAELASKFLIVSDVYPTATTRLADLVLPSAMWVEKNGMYGNSERRTQHWFRMVDPPEDARDDCWQTIAVAHRLLEKGHEGMKGRDGRFIFHIEDAGGNSVPIWEWEHYYDVNVDEHLFEEYRRFTPYKQKDLAPYGEYVRERGLRWPVVQQPDGTWRETRFRFSGFDDPYVAEGRDYQFYNSVTNDDRALIWFRPHEFPPEMPDDEYPFWLNTGRVLEHWHSGSMTRRIPELQRAVPRAYAEMHPDDARELGIHRDDIVRIESRRGMIDLPVWVGGRGKPPRGQVFVPFFDETMLINEVTLHEYDPFSRQPDYKKCAVRVSRSPMNRT